MKFALLGLLLIFAGCGSQEPQPVPHVPIISPSPNTVPDSNGCSEHDWYYAQEYRNAVDQKQNLNEAMADAKKLDEEALAALRYDTSIDAKIRRHELQYDLDSNFGNSFSEAVNDDWHQISKPCQAYLTSTH